tara:strand:+ start:115574 stop:118561 length:2988 start_codon:yes stop_codon:yes gene_type:complete
MDLSKVLWLVIALCPALGFSQSLVTYNSYWDQYVVRNVDRDDGLYRDEVYETFQDSSGFIWVANYAYMFRYDGLSMEPNSMGIGRTGVFDEFKVDSDGHLWIPGTGIGLHRIMGDSIRTFTSADGIQGSSIRTLSFTKGDSVFVGDYLHGVSVIYQDSVIFTIDEASGLAGDRVFRIFTDSRNNVWIGTTNGLSIYRNGSLTTFSTENGLPENSIKVIKELKNGEIWVATEKSGIVIFRDTKPVRYLTQKEGLSGELVSEIEEHPVDGSIWLSYYGSGVDRLFEGHIENLNSTDGLISDFTNSIMFDDRNRAYIGTNIGMTILIPRKVDVIDADTPGFGDASLNGVAEGKDGTVWVSTSGNGFRYFKNGSWNSPGSDMLKTESGLAILALNNGDMVLSTRSSGIYMVRNFEVTDHLDTDSGLSGDEITCLAQDHMDRIWVGSFNGIDVLDTDFNILYTLTTDDGIPSHACLQMITDHEQNIWIGSLYGGAFNMKDREVLATYDTSDGLSTEKVFGLFESSDQTLWLLTTDYGFHGVKDGAFTRYYGTPDTFVGMTEDHNGNYWFASNGYVVFLDTTDFKKLADNELEQLRFQRFNADDGVPAARFSYGNSSVITTLSTGEVLIPSLKGLLVIDPEKVVHDEINFFPYINKLQINGEEQTTTGSVTLDPGNNRIEISYSALNLESPSKTKFRIRLQGMDDEWVNVGDRRTAFYDYLPDGNYTFQVSATGPDGIWNQHLASLAITVNPPFYKMWWFRLLALLSFGLLIAAAVRIQSNIKVQKLNRELALQQKIQHERERISRDLHDNVGSQITNLITGIEISNLHIKKDQGDKAIDLLQQLDMDARGAMTELRETIWLLDRDTITIKEFESHLRNYIKRNEYALKGLSVTINNSVDTETWLNPTQSLHLLRITQETLNNCNKYAQADTFTINIAQRDNIIDLEFIDDGTGFEMNGHAEAGNGLKNMQERAGELNGVLKIESTGGKGTSITLSFPIIP